MAFAVVELLVTQLLLPVVFIVGLWRGRAAGRQPSRLSWLVGVVGPCAFILYFLLVGRWDWTSYYLRPALLVAMLLALFASFRKTFGGEERLPWWRSPGTLGGWTTLVANAVLALVFATLIVLGARGFSYDDRGAVDLSFPLRDGVYYVGQGGNSPLLNYHNVDRAQRFALDLVRFNLAGTRSVGIYPSDPSRYAVFGAEVRSPCGGEVVEAVGHRPDLSPPQTDTRHLAGNHVMVRCGREDVDVLLAHMKEDSVAVEKGQWVEEGQPLGRVGNSGNTSEPHLHLHAVRSGTGSFLDGEGVPIVFDGRFLVRNSLVS